LDTLNTTLCWFKHISPSTVDKFTQNDADHLAKIVPGISDSLLLFKEFQQFTPKIQECSDLREVTRLLKSMHTYFPRLALVYQFMLTLPVTVASNERSFSKLKLTKNYLRNAMTNNRLFFLLIGSIETDLLDEIDIQKLACDWAKAKDRRILI
jgi:hypothetical protein